ncbi:MAG TPA: MFS transporter [Candidatus Limnocylindrales bacterium]|nr:MFS transporter [Candidatus Limnocylindrales bacterium]
MLIAGIALGLILGLVVGGSLVNLAYVRLFRMWLLVAAVLLRSVTEILLNTGFGPAETLRLPLLAGAFALLLLALWPNRRFPGISLAFVGTLANAIVIVVNGGFMPIWEPSLRLAGLTPAEVTSALHVVLPGALNASFLLHLGPFGDVIPIPLPFIQNVASIGDAFLTLGLAFFLFAGVVRLPGAPERERLEAEALGRGWRTAPNRRPRVGDEGAETGLSAALNASVALERPLVLGSAAAGLSSPSLSRYQADALALDDDDTVLIPIPFPSPETVARVRQHPYVRLALNGSFSALWAGQLISLFGDRLNQLALVAVVQISTGSVLATGLVFFAATLPNLLLSPIAGTFVDRWDHKEVMVASDILRAAIVLVLPIAAVTNIILVYPLIFLVTTVSVFFRPARVAILPQIVPEEDLLSANSALWVGETIADVVGYPLAGVFVALLGSAVPIAFWVDSATYLASAALLATIVVHARRRSVDRQAGRPDFAAELAAGWQFLRHETVLLANTLQGAAGQFSLGIAIALTPSFVQATYNQSSFGWQAAYGFLETGIGVGNLLGGFLIGLIGARFAKGRMVILGYTAWGLLIFLFAITNNLPVALGLAFGQGVANMIFIIPSQTLFQERTPPELMGRVVGFRFALVFGSMTIAMALGAILGQVLGPMPVIGAFGLVTAVAGLAGLLVPAVRDA